MVKPERRTAPRVEVVDQLLGQIVTFPVRLLLRDLGPGGFSLEAPLPFPKDTPRGSVRQPEQPAGNDRTHGTANLNGLERHLEKPAQ